MYNTFGKFRPIAFLKNMKIILENIDSFTMSIYLNGDHWALGLMMTTNHLKTNTTWAKKIFKKANCVALVGYEERFDPLEKLKFEEGEMVLMQNL